MLWIYIVFVVIAIVCVLLFILTWIYNLLSAPGLNVTGHHVFITGGTKGLGLEIAKEYAKRGAKLSLVGRNIANLEAAKQNILQELQEMKMEQDKIPIYIAECDITDIEAVNIAIHNANEFHEQVTDHLICAASTKRPTPMVGAQLGTVSANQDASVDMKWKQTIDVNYYGAIHVLKCALPLMIEHQRENVSKRTQRIVLVSSSEALTSKLIGWSAFTSSCVALKGLADALRNEMLMYDISVSIFYPDQIGGANEETVKLYPNSAYEAEPDNISTDYATFVDIPTPATQAKYLAQCKSLITGLKQGKFAITSSWNGTILRMLSNGISPRGNSLLEFICLPFLAATSRLFYKKHAN